MLLMLVPLYTLTAEVSWLGATVAWTGVLLMGTVFINSSRNMCLCPHRKRNMVSKMSPPTLLEECMCVFVTAVITVIHHQGKRNWFSFVP